MVRWGTPLGKILKVDTVAKTPSTAKQVDLAIAAEGPSERDTKGTYVEEREGSATEPVKPSDIHGDGTGGADFVVHPSSWMLKSQTAVLKAVPSDPGES